MTAHCTGHQMIKAFEPGNSGVGMRRQGKIILWPVYFDSTKTRTEGRRVRKGLAVPSPKLEEIRRAVERAGLRPEVISDTGHPSAPWKKTGLVAVPKRGPKTEIMRRVAEELLNIRRKP